MKIDKERGEVIIPLSEWEEIQEQLAWIDALEQAGVDNWDGISEAQQIFHENNPQYEEN